MKIRGRVKENYVFLGLVAFVFVFGVYGLVKTPQKTSYTENRSLEQYKHFTIKDFISGEFQDNFEKALSDQFVFSEKIRMTYGEIMNGLPAFGIDAAVCNNRYVVLNGAQYTDAVYNCSDYMTALPMDPSDKQMELIETNIKKYSRINNMIDTYYYFIDESNVYDFSKGEKVIDIKQILREKLKGNYALTSLHYNGFDEYKKYFYKTDHHLNHEGQYQAYLDITKLLGITNPNKPVELINHHEYYFGSRAKDARNYSFLDEFQFYKYDLPKHDTMVNRKVAEYGHYDEFEKHEYNATRLFNYYAYVYGPNSGEAVFDYHNSDKDNLLILSNSFDNPIAPVIAQYFNKTYAVDLRYYKKNLGEDFVFSEYVKKNKIDKVLFIMSSRYILDKNSNVGLEL